MDETMTSTESRHRERDVTDYRTEVAAKAMREKRRELQQLPLDRIYNELAEAAILAWLGGTAADEIERLREALAPFAKQADCWPFIPDNQAMMTSNGEDLSSLDFEMSDLRRARALTSPKQS